MSYGCHNREPFKATLMVQDGYHEYRDERITVAGKYIHIGYFDTREQAHRAYIEAKRQYHPYSTL